MKTPTLDPSAGHFRASAPSGSTGESWSHSNINSVIEPAWEMRSEDTRPKKEYKGFSQFVLDKLTGKRIR